MFLQTTSIFYLANYHLENCLYFANCLYLANCHVLFLQHWAMNYDLITHGAAVDLRKLLFLQCYTNFIRCLTW